MRSFYSFITIALFFCLFSLLCLAAETTAESHYSNTSPNPHVHRSSFLQRSASSFSYLLDDVVEALPADIHQWVQTTSFYSSLEQAEQQAAHMEAQAQTTHQTTSATHKRLAQMRTTTSSSTSTSSSRMTVFASNVTATSKLTDEQRALVSARYSTSKKALKMRDQSPRFRQPASGKEFKPADTDYIISIALYLAVGIACAAIAIVFTFFVYLFYCLWDCCCRDRGKAYTTYLGYARWFPFATGVMFGLLFCAFCAVGLVANSSLSGRFTQSSSNSLGATSDRVITTISDFFTGIVNKLLDIVNTTPDINTGVSKIINGITGLETGTSKLTSDLNTFGQTYTSSYKVNVPISTYGAAAMVYNCTGCAGFSTPVSTSVSYLTDNVQPEFDKYSQTTKDVEDTFLKASNSIVEQGNKAKDTVANAQDKIVGNSTRSKLRDFWDNADKYEKYRWDVMTAIFCIPLGIFLCFLGGGGLKSRTLFYCSCCSGWFLAIVLFIVFGVHWFLGSLMGDICATTDIYVTDIDSYVSGDAAIVLNSCLINTSVLAGLGYESQLNFSDIIKFPTAPDVNQLFNVPGFDTFVSTVNSANIYTMFDFNFNSIPNAFTDLNAVTKLDNTQGNYNRNNLYSTYSSLLYDNSGVSPTRREQASSRFALLDQYLISETRVTNALTQMQNNITAISNLKTSIQTNFSNTVNAINNASTLLDPLITQVNSLKGMAYCQSLVDVFFYDFKGVVCNDVTTDVSNLAMALFFISFSLWFVVWISRSMAHRIRKPQVSPMVDEWHDNTDEWLAKTGPAAAETYGSEMVAPSANHQWMTDDQGQWISSQHNKTAENKLYEAPVADPQPQPQSQSQPQPQSQAQPQAQPSAPSVDAADSNTSLHYIAPPIEGEVPQHQNAPMDIENQGDVHVFAVQEQEQEQTQSPQSLEELTQPAAQDTSFEQATTEPVEEQQQAAE